MTRRATLVILVAIAVSLPALGEGFEILPPNTTAYSPTEVATLEGAIATLRGVLNDYDLGAYRYFDLANGRASISPPTLREPWRD